MMSTVMKVISPDPRPAPRNKMLLCNWVASFILPLQHANVCVVDRDFRPLSALQRCGRARWLLVPLAAVRP